MTQLDPIDSTPETNKWQLAAGGTVYAPQHPQYLHVPGFWDEVLVGEQAFSKLLCVSFVLEREGELIELDPHLSYWYWYPDRIEARYYLVTREGIGYKQQAGVRVFLEEKRYIAADGSLHCEFRFDLLKQHPSQLEVVAWGVDAQLESSEGQQPVSVGQAPVQEPVVPKLAHTPFLEMLRSGSLSSNTESGKYTLNAVHWNVTLAVDNPVTLHVKCNP